MSTFGEEFFRNDYMPHGHCYLWQPGILWSNVISDLLIATSYFTIAIALYIYFNKRKAQKFRSIILLFATFILTCGMTHLFAIYTIWNGSYGIHGILKSITAVASVSTMIVLLLNLDKIIAIPTLSELKEAEKNAAKEKLKRAKLEVESKANAIFKFALELFPTGIIVVDKKQNIILANKLVEHIFGYSENALVGKSINCLIEDELAASHQVMVSDYMNHAEKRDMNSGRLVWGRKTDGHPVPVDVTLAAHEFENEQYTFASVTSVSDVGIQKKRFLETSRRLQRAVDATDVGIWEWNLLNNKVWFSPKLISLLSTDKEQHEIMLDDWQTHIHPDDYERVSKVLEGHLAQKNEYEVVYRGKDKHGEYNWLRTKGDTVFDDSGKPILMSGTLTNINKLHNLQLEIEHKNSFLDAVLSQSTATVLVVDVKKMSLEYSNDRLNEMFDYQHGDIENLINSDSLPNIVHPSDLLSSKAFLEKVASNATNDETEIVVRIQRKSGEYLWCILRASLYINDQEEGVKQVLLSIIDISDIKMREENIKVLAKDFLDTFEQAAVGISHIDVNGKWLRVNQKLCDSLGYTKEEILETNFQDISHPDDLKAYQLNFNKLIQGEEQTFVLEKRVLHKQRYTLWVRLTVSTVLDEEGHHSYFITVLEDISQQKQMQNDLLRSNDELEQFAYVASHDLKEPIRTLKTFTSYLISDLEQNKTERVKQDKEFIDSAAKRMTRIIDDLLAFSKVGNAKVMLQSVDLNEVVQQTLTDISVNIEEKQADIKCQLDLPIVYSDPTLLGLAIQNLLQNALKFTAKDTLPVITINASVEKTKVFLHIADNGLGIAKEHQQQIFGIFKKLHNADDYPGTGIGLAVVKKILAKVSGKITISSELGSGSVFTIQLPKR